MTYVICIFILFVVNFSNKKAEEKTRFFVLLLPVLLYRKLLCYVHAVE